MEKDDKYSIKDLVSIKISPMHYIEVDKSIITSSFQGI